jgi:hypothetical protein
VIVDGTFRARDGAPVVEAGAPSGNGGPGAARS